MFQFAVKELIYIFFQLVLNSCPLFEGCYPDSIESLQNVAVKTMIIGSVGMCQEICYHEKSYKFAVKVGIHIAQHTTEVKFNINSVCINIMFFLLFYALDEYMFML